MTASAQQPAAGLVKVVAGAAVVVRGGQEAALKLGDPIMSSDTVRTGADGRLGITLKDETRISLGPDTELSLTRYTFAPAAGQFALVMRIVRGAVAYISGRLAKLAPDAIRIETPTSIVGVRGTHLLIAAGTAGGRSGGRGR